MTIQRHINTARQHLTLGNKEAYLKLMTFGVRSAISTRSANQYIKAAKEDGFTI